ncbi:MAG: type II secretion system protein [Candidatus Azambacteria bacterium]|nr:type II secretion system protein [Candidatus Azambacteria bacterium]
MISIFNKNNGFTLIEVLGVLGIITLFSGVTIFSISSERQNSSLFRSAQNLSLNLRRAQSFALSSKDFKGSGVPCGWGVHFNGLNSTNYIIFADLVPFGLDCQSNQDSKRNPNGSEDFEVVNFEAGIKIGGLTDDFTDVVFSPPEPTVVFYPSSQSEVNVTVINRYSSARVVTVNKTGFISSP